MSNLPYRTNATWLTDDDLILLDVLFDGGATFRLLRRSVFRDQWNLGYSHRLNDDELHRRLAWLCERGVLETTVDTDGTFFDLTAAGGKLWSEERCPVWERYCAVQRTTELPSKGRTVLAAIAVSPQILDEFLRLVPRCRVRRRTAIVPGDGYLPWLRFPRLYLGIVAYSEWTPEEYSDRDQRYLEHRTRLELERSWWGDIKELQRFTPGGG